MVVLEAWIAQFDPALGILVVGGIFLIAGIAGWYVGDVILWLSPHKNARPFGDRK